jgi:hypothetical protein
MTAEFGYRAIPLHVIKVVTFWLLIVGISGCGKKSEAPYGPGGKWIDNMRERITQEIEDPDKSIRLLEQVDRLEAVLIELDDTLVQYYEELQELDADYSSKREDFQNAIDSFNEYRAETLGRLVNIVLEMKKIAGRADWSIVSDIDGTLYESWQRSLGS